MYIYIYMYTFQHRPRPQISCVLDLRESWNTVSKASRRRFSFIVPAFEDMEAAGPAMIPRGVINFQRPFGRPRSWLCLLCREFFFVRYRAQLSVETKTTAKQYTQAWLPTHILALALCGNKLWSWVSGFRAIFSGMVSP